MTAALKAIHAEDPIAPHVRAMLKNLGEDPARQGLAQTPARYAKAMRYLAGGYALDVESVLGSGVFAAEGAGAVVVRDIEFHSLCEHHLLPFYGTVHVGYLPGNQIIGLSKIARLVDLFARRFQVQERLTEQVADALMQALEPKGVVVIAEARHLCMAMRGVQKQTAVTVTRALRGAHEEIVPLMKGR
jgi:GTP cyclohydrolase IA